MDKIYKIDQDLSFDKRFDLLNILYSLKAAIS